MTSLKKPFYSALVFFGTLIVLSVGYAAYSLSTESANAPLTSTKWNNVINAVNDLDTRVTSLVAGGGNLWSTGASSSISYSAGKVKVGSTSGNAELQIGSENKTPWGIYHDVTSEELRFWNGSNRVVFGSGGNVGIGVTGSPGAKLDVQWGRTLVAGLDATNGNSIRIMSTAGSNTYADTGYFQIGYATDNQAGLQINASGGLGFWNAGGGSWTQKMVLTNAGNVGIGTTSPGDKLEVNGNLRLGVGMGSIDFKRTSDNWNPATIVVSQDNYKGTISFKQNTTDGISDAPTTTMTLYRGNVGIGTTGPSTKLEVSWGSVNIPYRASYTDGYKLGVGNYNGYIFRNYTVPYHDTMYISTNWTLTDAGASSVTNAGALTTALGIGSNNGAGGFSFKTGGGAGIAPVTRVAMLDNGNVLIGTTSDAGYKLDVNGAVRGTSWANSDRNLKKNIETLSGGLGAILSIRGVRYDWKDSSKGTGSQVGVIAQEVEQVLPELVYTDKQGMKAVNYAGLVAPLIEAVKELKKENDSLKKENQDIKSLLCLDHPTASICK